MEEMIIGLLWLLNFSQGGTQDDDKQTKQDE